MLRRRLMKSDGIHEFSVSDTNKVYFSNGNLQYQASSTTWRFAEHQYDYVGDATNGNVYVGSTKSNNANISSSYNGWIDLFGWGTGDNPTKTSTNTRDYSTFNDWGTAAVSSIGTGWRTLSKDEWLYMFNTRTVNNGTGSGKSYTLGQKVNDVLGVVLYPDDYTGAAYTTGSDWATFESAGCVFLPAAGLRSGTSVSRVDEYGRYWSSTAYDTDHAYCAGFYSGGVNPAYYDKGYRDRGFSVRLVHDMT